MRRTTTLISLVVLVGVLVGLTTVGLWYAHIEEGSKRSVVDADLRAIARLKCDQIVFWRRERLADAAVLMDNGPLRDAIAGWIEHREETIRADILDVFHSLQDHYGYHDVHLVDPTGVILFSLGTAKQLVEPALLANLATALMECHPVMSELHLEPNGCKPHQGILAPILSRTGDRAIAAVLLVDDARNFLFPLIQTWPTDSRSAETLLVRRESDTVLFLNDLRHHPNTALQFRLGLDRLDLPAARAVTGLANVERSRDYRGIEVLSCIQQVPDTNWFMIAKVDADEALANLRRRSRDILLGLALLLLTVGAGFMVFWQRQREVQYRSLFQAERARRQAEERHLVTLRSIGDAVITTDGAGRVTLLNPVAEHLTGWTDAGARGRPLEEAFVIVNQQSRAAVENPVNRVLREGCIIGLANHTVLIARDGRERPIADSGAPIRDETGTIVGVVLVFRDMTEGHAREQRLLEQERILDQTGRMARIGGWEHDPATGRSIWTRVLYEIMELDPDVAPPGVEDHFACYLPQDRAILEPAFRRAVADGTGFDLELQVQTATGRTIWVRIYGEAVMTAGHGVILRGIIQDISAAKAAVEENRQLQAQLTQAQKMESIGRLAGGVAHDFNNMLQVISGNLDLVLSREALPEATRTNLYEALDAARRSADLTRQLLALARKQTVAPQVLDLNAAVTETLRMLRRLIGEDIDLVWTGGTGLWPVKVDPGQIDQVLANLCVNARDAITGTGKVIIETANRSFDAAFCCLHEGCIAGDYVCLVFSDDGCGMDQATREQIFDPFFTTKAVGEGTGLGLATVYGIVRQNGGFITVSSEPEMGTTFKLNLPRYTGDQPVAKNRCLVPPRRSRGETVLLVEDVQVLLDLCTTMLEELGYVVLAAATPRAAIRLAEGHSDPIALLLTDVVMPGMNGRVLGERIMALHPELKILYMSGYTADVIAHRGILDDGITFLQKPFCAAELGAKLREILGGDGADGADGMEADDTVG